MFSEPEPAPGKKIPRAGAASKPDGSGQRCMARVLKKSTIKYRYGPFSGFGQNVRIRLDPNHGSKLRDEGI